MQAARPRSSLLVRTGWLGEQLHGPGLRVVNIRGSIKPPSAPPPHHSAKHSRSSSIVVPACPPPSGFWPSSWLVLRESRTSRVPGTSGSRILPIQSRAARALRP